MINYECPICTGKMCLYGYDGLVCIKCGFVAQGPIVSGQLTIA